MSEDKNKKWHFCVGGVIEYGPYTFVEARRLARKNDGSAPYRKDSVIFPTTRDAKDERAVYEWPDGTWCWHDELHEMTHMSDDYALVFYDAEKHN